MRKRLLRAAVASLCCAALLANSGCYGKSPTTAAVIKWHHGLEMDKYLKEGVYLPVFFLVLPLTALLDNFIINSIAYWSNDDPLEAEPIISSGNSESSGTATTETAKDG